VAWSIAQGAVPYRDLFEHHTPLFHYLLSALWDRSTPNGPARPGLGALLLAREVTWAVSGIVIGLTALLARRLFGSTTAWLSLALTATSIVVGLRAPEIRPDGLSTALWIGCLIFFDAALRRRDQSDWRAKGLFMASGLSISLAVLTSQKLLLAGPALALVVCLYAFGRREGTRLPQRMANVIWQTAGVVLPWFLAWVFFWSQGAAKVLRGSHIRPEPRMGCGDVGVESSIVCGAVRSVAARTWRRRSGRAHSRHLGPRTWNPHRASGAVPLAVIGPLCVEHTRDVRRPVRHSSAVPAVLPHIHAALCHRGRATAGSCHGGHEPYGAQSCTGPAVGRDGVLALVVAAAVAGGTAFVTLNVARPVVVRVWIYPSLIAAGALAVALLPVYRRPVLALSAVLGVLAIYPVQWSTWLAALDDQRQYAAIRYVLDRSVPGATVMDGWTGYGVFRPHAWYYWMLHSGVRAGIPARDVAALEEDLVAGRIRPDLVVLDADLRRLSGRIAAHVEAEYDGRRRSPICTCSTPPDRLPITFVAMRWSGCRAVRPTVRSSSVR
jgi:hypothetical protein